MKKNKTRLQSAINLILYGCLLIGAFYGVRTWWNSPSDKSSNSPSTAHEQSKYRSYDFKVEGEDNYSDSDHYIGTVTEDRVCLKLDYVNEGTRKVTTLDFSPRTGKGVWTTTYPETATLIHKAKSVSGSLTALPNDSVYDIYQITLEYNGDILGFGALVPVTTGS